MKYKIEKNTVQETLIFRCMPGRSAQNYTRISIGMKRLSV